MGPKNIPSNLCDIKIKYLKEEPSYTFRDLNLLGDLFGSSQIKSVMDACATYKQNPDECLINFVFCLFDGSARKDILRVIFDFKYEDLPLHINSFTEGSDAIKEGYLQTVINWRLKIGR